MQHAFLRSIADGYYRSEQMNIQEYTFVFPNSRSAQYFKMYLGEQTTIEGTKLRGMTLTMSELFEKGAGLRRASRNELLMSVYAAYCRVSARMNPGLQPQEFDRFRFWGEMLLKDFDEIDRYMIDPKMIFRNVADYKEIQSYYLTDEQLEIIRNFWGEDPYWNRTSVSAGKSDLELPFWAHINPAADSDKPDGKFMQLWEMMLPIYEELHLILKEKGKCYPGMACREVVRVLKTTGRLPFNPKKYVFIGFHRLTMAEHVVFDEMQRLGIAHFYWDYDPALMNPETGNKAGRFIANYQKYFTASLPAVQLPPGGGEHTVEVIGVGSNVGQAKVAAQLLERADTAVVLPSDALLLPLLTSIPERFSQINITMGCPLRYSLLSQLYSALTSLQIHSRRRSDGRVEFFRDDVMRLLANPLLRSKCPDELTAIADLMREKRLYNLPEKEISERVGELPVMSVLLTRVDNAADLGQVADYTRRFIALFDAAVDETPSMMTLEEKAASTLCDEIDELEELCREFDIKMTENTFFRLLEQSLFHRSLAVKGISFEALQIMGVLETRALGFDNVMMLSMTDSVFPGRTSSKSFIPDSLRHAYGMPTSEHYESDYAYYFFRILSNSRNLTLIYDSRTGGLRSGEKSRFIEQLLHVPFPGVTIRSSNANFSSSLADISSVEPLIPQGVEVRKDDRIMALLNRYTDPELKFKYKLSASALKTYLHCPLQFYLERVEGVRPADPVKEDIDQGIIGNIEHEVAERLYERLPVREIDSRVIANIIAGGYDDILNREIRRSFNVNFVGIPAKLPNPQNPDEKIENPEAYTAELFGQAMVYEPAIRQALVDMLNAEPVPFTFEHGELSDTFSWKLTPELAFNFTMKIDRVDRENGVTRLVDYKTGKDKTDFTESNIMVREDTNLRAGIFQLLTYCYAYLNRHTELTKADVKPLIYTLKSIPLTGTFPDLKLGSETKNVPLRDYAQVAEWFEPMFIELISEIFDRKVPFRSTTNQDMCTYCKFQRYCHAVPLQAY